MVKEMSSNCEVQVPIAKKGASQSKAKKINRDEFLKTLELVQFGVPPKETVSFSKQFVFQDGRVFSYDDEILCKIKSGLDKEISGAVDAQRLLGILRKLSDVELNLEQKNGEIVLFDNKGKKAFFRVEKIEGQELPSDQVESPGEYETLEQGFDEAIKLAQGCARDRDSTFSRTCVHITHDYIEAYDNYQMIRYAIKTPLSSKSILVRKEAVKHISSLGLNKFSETENWIHFKGPSGLVYSCRRWLEEYPDLSEYFEHEGKVITLPSKLEDIIDRANEFSQELADANRVKVEIKGGKVIVTGMGITGRYEESRSLESKEGIKEVGDFAFLIAPDLLTNVVKKNQQVQITDNMLIAKGDHWTYLAILINPDEVEVLEELNNDYQGNENEENYE